MLTKGEEEVMLEEPTGIFGFADNNYGIQGFATFSHQNTDWS
jgi:hypothetical protein